MERSLWSLTVMGKANDIQRHTEEQTRNDTHKTSKNLAQL